MATVTISASMLEIAFAAVVIGAGARLGWVAMGWALIRIAAPGQK